jgi:hypothetical protein
LLHLWRCLSMSSDTQMIVLRGDGTVRYWPYQPVVLALTTACDLILIRHHPWWCLLRDRRWWKSAQSDPHLVWCVHMNGPELEALVRVPIIRPKVRKYHSKSAVRKKRCLAWLLLVSCVRSPPHIAYAGIKRHNWFDTAQSLVVIVSKAVNCLMEALESLL